MAVDVGRMSRRVFAWHRWLGIGIGVLLVVIGLTGALLVFGDAIDQRRHAALTTVALLPGARARSLDTLVAAMRAARPDARLLAVRLPSGTQTMVATLDVRGERRLGYVHPYSGRVLGDRPPSAFWRGVLELHYELLAGRAGAVIGLLAAVGWVLASLTGFWVYRRSVLRVFRRPVRWRAGVRALAHDLHTLVGVGTLGFALVLGGTGIWFLRDAPAELWRSAPAAPVQPAAPLAVAISLQWAVHEAAARLPAFLPQRVTLPRRATDSVVTVSGRLGGAPLLGGSARVRLHAQTGAVVELYDPRQAPWATQLRHAVGPLHFGTWGGVWSQVLYVALGLAPAILAVSGYLLVRRRRQRREPTMPDRQSTTNRLSAPAPRRRSPVAAAASSAPTLHPLAESEIS